MALLDAIETYLEPRLKMVGLVPYPKDGGNENGLLFSATLITLLSPEDRDKMRSWFVDMVSACQVEPGLYHRYPGHWKVNSHDDLTGIAVASKLLGLPFHSDIYRYGLTHHWNWNDLAPGVLTPGTFLGRFIPFILFLKGTDDQPLNTEEKFTFAASLLESLRDPYEETNKKCLQLLKNRTMRGKSWLVDVAIWWWCRKMQQMYPGGPRELYREYYKPDPVTGELHPFSIYAPDRFA
jgi:hypothetical protein